MDNNNACWKHAIASIHFEFQRYKSLGDRTFDQLDLADLHHRKSKSDNSIALLVKHLCGNMNSRFTAILTEDGEKSWRNRDTEFSDPAEGKDKMLMSWENSWNLVFNTLKQLETESWNTSIFIRKEKHTLVQALLRQLAHYSYHIGQIVYLGKQIKGKEWINLSIPPGGSAEFNAKFLNNAQDKS